MHHREVANFAFEKMKSAINQCIDNFSNKTNHPKQVFSSWKNIVFEKVKLKIDIFKRKNKLFKTTQVLQDPTVITYFEELHSRFVIIPIDKASNKYALICKYFYISKLLKKIGLNGTASTAYNISEFTKKPIITSQSFELEVGQDLKSLPIMYWTLELHKSSIGLRFIVASKISYSKPLTSI